ncbi:MAG TPA: cell division protein FtsZ [Prolixibacteraceae bacterium]|nr:cell division protein FtsZ [Prolixibacteraceae bacterium]
MSDELLSFCCEPNQSAQIKVIGVGGGGGNAVNYMYRKGIAGVGFMICNTDAQALRNSPVPVTFQLGESLTKGRGAGNMPELGEQAAIESIEEIKTCLEANTHMAFITACMGGGTGTGAAPVIAKACRELNILTIAVVTVPSRSEGRKRYEQALDGLEKIREHVDSLLVINNEKIREIYGNLPASEAFSKADEILATAVKGVAEIITLHGNINIDFADVHTVMSGSKVFIMGTGFAEGDDRAIQAAKAALESPLLDSNNIFGTKDILLNISSGEDEITIGEIGEIIEFLQDKAGSEANIIWGNGCDVKLKKKISVTVIATGFRVNPSAILQHLDREPEESVALAPDAEDLFPPADDKPEELEMAEVEKNPDPAPVDKKTRKKGETKIPAPAKEKQKAKSSWFMRQLDLFFEENSTEME